MPDTFVSMIRPGASDPLEPSDEMIAQRFYVPTSEARERVERYVKADRLLDVEQHARHFKINGDDQEFYIPVDLPGMLTRLMRHYTFGPRFAIEAVSGGVQPEIERIVENSDLVTLFREVAETLPAFGDAVFRVDLVDPEDVGSEDENLQAAVRYVAPHYFHPEIDPLDGRRLTGATLAWLFPASKFSAAEGLGVRENDDRQILLREVFESPEEKGDEWTSHFMLHWFHDGKTAGEIPVESAFPGLSAEPEGVGCDEIPLVFLGHNRKAGKFWGRSDFPRIEPIVRALENRLAQLDEVLEKHARPKLVVGPGTLDDDGQKMLKHFDVIEVDNSILENAVKPEYLTWNMQIEAIKHQIEKLEEYFFMVTETSPASFGLERDGSQVESARALRFKAHRTVNRVEDGRDPWGDAIRRIFRIAQKMETSQQGGHSYSPSKIRIKWPDPILDDRTQEAQDFSAMKANGLVSVKRAAMSLFDLSEEEAEREREEILRDETDFSEATAPSAGTGPIPGEADLLGAEAGGSPPPGSTPPEEEEPEIPEGVEPSDAV